MLFLIVGLYFLLACVAAWLILFPSGRETVTLAIQAARKRLGANISTLETQVSRKKDSIGQSVQLSVVEFRHILRQHFLLLLTAVIIIVVPVLIAILVGRQHRLDGFESSTYETNVQIAELLKGEQLVPPAPLPPAVFVTKEVLEIRPMLASASRNWKLLDLGFEQRILLVFKLMKEKYGYEMAIIEGYRSPERQNQLSRMGAHVTNAKAYQSYHQFGLAADCAFYRNGKLVISEKDPWAMKGYELYGMVAESVGLTWGGRWKMMDLGHTEFRPPGGLKRLNIERSLSLEENS